MRLSAARYITPSTVLLMIVVVSLLTRLALVLSHQGFLGVDGGAYLLSRNDVLGIDMYVTGPGLPRPPLAPGWLLVPWTAVLGDDVGFKAFSAVFSLAPILASYVLARSLLPNPWHAIFVAGFLSIDIWHAEMLVTGVMPLIGFSLIMLSLWAMGRLSIALDARAATVLVVALPLIAYTNQTSAGLAALLLPAYALMLAVLAGPRSLRYIVPLGAVGGLLALSALPWYVAQMPGSDRVHYPGPYVYVTNWADSAWIQVSIGLPFGLWTLVKAPDPRLRALGGLTAIIASLTPFLSYDEAVINIFYRSRYLLPLPLYVCVAWVTFTSWWPRVTPNVQRVGLVVVAAIILFGYVHIFGRQAGYSLMVSDNTAQAMTLMKGDGRVITNAYTLALWVSALERRPSSWIWTALPPAQFQAEEVLVRCVLGWSPGCDPARASVALDATYVLIDTRFPRLNLRVPGNYLAPPDQWSVTASAPWLALKYYEGTTMLWRIGESGVLPR